MNLSKQKLANSQSVSSSARGRFEEFREFLLNRRRSVIRDLKQTSAEIIHDDSTYSDTIDVASAITDKNLAMQMKGRECANLLEIDQALRRIDNGVFGVCERCEEEIGDARLHANPTTTLCIDCKSELESERGHGFGRAYA